MQARAGTLLHHSTQDPDRRNSLYQDTSIHGKPKRLDEYLSLVGAEGFEPPTRWSQTRCATRLRYAPTVFSLSHRVAVGPSKRAEHAVGVHTKQRVHQA